MLHLLVKLVLRIFKCGDMQLNIPVLVHIKTEQLDIRHLFKQKEETCKKSKSIKTHTI